MATRRPDTLARLYEAPLSDFIRERDAQVARLREAGRRDEALALKSVRKPGVPLWAVNHVARQHPESVSRFIDAVDRLRQAQLGRTGSTADHVKQERATLNELLDHARRALRDTGLRATDATLARISATLLGAAADREARDDLRSGRLSEERAAPGFEVFSGERVTARPATRGNRRLELVKPAREQPAASAHRPESAPAKRRVGRQSEDGRVKRDVAPQPERAPVKRDIARAAGRREQAERRRLRELEREAARQERQADQATADAARLRERLVELDRRAGEARRAAERARQTARGIRPADR